MRLWPLYGALLLFFLCTCVAAGGPKAARSAHQPRKVNQIIHANDKSLGKILAQGSSELSLDSKTPEKCKLMSHSAIMPRAVTPALGNKFCRPKSASTANGAQGNSKSSAHSFACDRGKWIMSTLTSLVVVTFLYSL